MAIITPIATAIAGGWLVGWYGLASGDSGMPWPSDAAPHPNDVATLTDRCVQLFGGTVGTLFVEGSNAIATTANAWATLHLVDGTTACSMTTAGIRQVLEASYFTRPVMTAGSSGTCVLMKFVQSAQRY